MQNFGLQGICLSRVYGFSFGKTIASLLIMGFLSQPLWFSLTLALPFPLPKQMKKKMLFEIDNTNAF